MSDVWMAAIFSWISGFLIGLWTAIGFDLRKRLS